MVDLWNSFQLFKIGRTIDYTDLFALSVLPLSYFYFKTEKQKTFSLSFAKRILASFVVLLSVFAFTATSYVEDRMAMIEGEYNFKLNKLVIESILKQNERVLNLKMERETDVFPANKYPDVKADQNVFFASFSVKQNICDSKFPLLSRKKKNLVTSKLALFILSAKKNQ